MQRIVQRDARLAMARTAGDCVRTPTLLLRSRCDRDGVPIASAIGAPVQTFGDVEQIFGANQQVLHYELRYVVRTHRIRQVCGVFSDTLLADSGFAWCQSRNGGPFWELVGS
jgi:hypothetical protein